MMASSTKPATCCERDWRHRLGYRWMTPEHGTRWRTAFAHRSAMTGSPRPAPGQALVRHAVIGEPIELPRSAACRPYRFRVERHGVQLHAWPCTARHLDRPTGRTAGYGLHRSVRLAGASRAAWLRRTDHRTR